MASHRWRPSRPRTGPAHLRHPRLAAAVGALVAAALVVLSGNPAAAEPSAATIEQQIDRAWNRLEPVIEQHNLARQDLTAKRQRAADLTAKIRPLERQVDVALGQVGKFAAFSYKGGGLSAVNAMLAGSPAGMVDQMGLLDQYAKRQQSQIRNVVELKAKYDAQKLPLLTLIADLTKTEAQLAAKEKQIEAEIKKLQDMRLAAYGNGGSTGSLRPVACPVTYPGGAAGTAIKFACAQIGKPYRFGAEGLAAYDCSGLTMAAWQRAGVSLPHNAAAQRRATKSVSRANLRVGDLVFYYSDLHHVGMYAGGGWIVHASRAGEPLQMRRLDVAPVHSFGRPG